VVGKERILRKIKPLQNKIVKALPSLNIPQ